MDGTMVNNMAYHKKAWQEFFRRHDMTLTEDKFRQKVSGKKNDQIFEIVFGKKPTPTEIKALTEEKESIYRELYRQDVREIEGLTHIIDELHRKGIKTAIATTAPAKNREFILASLQLAGRFEIVLGDEHVTYGKPNPEIYLSTASKLSVAPHECLVFEDSPPGVAAGKRAGMTVVGILSSHNSEELHEADYIIDNYAQLSLN